MKKSYLELKIVALDLQELERLIKIYEDLGFSHSGLSQDDGITYWTFLTMNNGLIDTDYPNI